MKRSMLALGCLLHVPFAFYVMHASPIPGMIVALIAIAAWPLFTGSETGE